MRTIINLMLGFLLLTLPLNTVMSQDVKSNMKHNDKKALTLRPNSSENNPTRRDNLKVKTLKFKKPDPVISGKQLAKGQSKIKPNKKAIQQRREAKKNRIKVQKRALKR